MVRGNLQTPNWRDALEVYKNGHVLSECNLLDFPICLLSNNNSKELLKKSAEQGASHIRFEMVGDDGEKRVWEVRPSTVAGYTTPFDKSVVGTVQKLVTDEQFPPPMLWKLGSCRRICRTMKINDRGKNVSRVKEALKRIASSPIYAETFYSKRDDGYWHTKKKQKGGVFTLWSVFWEGEELPNGETADCIYLQFNIPFIWSLQAFYVKPVDYDYWLSLPPLAQRIYELTGRKFFGLKDSSYIKFDYHTYCQALPVQQHQHLSLAKQAFTRPHKRLKEDSWLDGIEWVDRRRRKLDPHQPWEIRYYPGPRAHLEIEEARERLRRFQQKAGRQSLLGQRSEEIEAWVATLTELLDDTLGRNKGYYRKIAKLIDQQKLSSDIIWEAAHTAKTEDLAGNLTSDRSAYFTGYVRKRLKERGAELDQLLQEA